MTAKKRQEPVLVDHLLCAGIFTLFSPQLPWEGSLAVLILQIGKQRLQGKTCSGCQRLVFKLVSQTRFCLISAPHFFLGGPSLHGGQQSHSQRCPGSLVMVVKSLWFFMESEMILLGESASPLLEVGDQLVLICLGLPSPSTGRLSLWKAPSPGHTSMASVPTSHPSFKSQKNTYKRIK